MPVASLHRLVRARGGTETGAHAAGLQSGAHAALPLARQQLSVR